MALVEEVVGDDERPPAPAPIAEAATPERRHQHDPAAEQAEADRRHRARRNLPRRDRPLRPFARVDRAVEIVVEIHAADVEQRHCEKYETGARSSANSPPAITVPASTLVHTVGTLDTRPELEQRGDRDRPYRR